jgi:hypothetical protein
VADVVIDAAFGSPALRGIRAQAWKDSDTGYQFYIDDDGTFGYSKTTDGGATWGAQVEIAAATTHIAFDIWFDKWTPGNSGTLIHTVYFDTTNDDVIYRSVDVADDSLSTAVVIEAESTAVADTGCHCSITRAIGGNLYVSWDVDNGAEIGFEVSTDVGASWSALTAGIEAADDWLVLLPAANTGDTQDVLGIYHDADADALTAKWYDASAPGWTESSSIATVVENTTDLTTQYPFAASIRHSDGMLIVAVLTERDSITADHRVFEIDRTAGAFAITELTAITTDIDDHYYPQVFIDQNTDDIYVAYAGKRDGSEVLSTAGNSESYYTKSTDDGSTWSAGDTAYSESTAGNGITKIWAPLMGPRFYVAARRGTVELEGNAVNSIAFSTAKILPADLGTFTFTGRDAGLSWDQRLTADSDSFALTVADAGLAWAHNLSAEFGEFVLSGGDVSFGPIVLSAAFGDFDLVGSDAGFSWAHSVSAEQGTFTFTGSDAELTFDGEVIVPPVQQPTASVGGGGLSWKDFVEAEFRRKHLSHLLDVEEKKLEKVEKKLKVARKKLKSLKKEPPEGILANLQALEFKRDKIENKIQALEVEMVPLELFLEAEIDEDDEEVMGIFH